MNDSVKAVIWDLGGVLVRTEDTSRRQLWEKRFSMQPWDLERLVHGNPVARRATIGVDSPDAVWDYVADTLNISANELDSLRVDFYAGDVLDTELINSIGELKLKFTTGLITNAWSNARHLIETKWNIAHVFDQILISAEIGIAKPDRRVYEMMMERINLPSQQILFIDDFHENIEAAKATGMRTILFQSPTQTINELGEQLRLQQ